MSTISTEDLNHGLNYQVISSFIPVLTSDQRHIKSIVLIHNLRFSYFLYTEPFGFLVGT